MISALKRLFAKRSQPQPVLALPQLPQVTQAPDRAAHAPGHPVRNTEDGEILWSDTPRYPAYDHGFPSSNPQNLLSQHKNLLERLSGASTYNGRQSQAAIRKVVDRYAEYVNCLPASYQENHYGAGGLLKLGLDVGFFSLQAANGVIFSNESADKRTVAEPRWKLATFIAGLACELNRVISHILVTNSEGDQWHPFVETLSDWLLKTKSDRFWVVWLTPTDAVHQKALVSFILPRIIPEEVINYLAEDRRVLIAMNAAIAGGTKMGEENPIRNVVDRVKHKIITQDIAKNANHLAKPQIGSHLEPHIADAIRTLFKTGAWTPNEKNGKLWVTTEGVFLIWKTSASDIMGRLRMNNTPGLPQDTETIYDILLASSVISKPDSGRFWSIKVKDAKSLIDAVRVEKVEMLFGDVSEYAKQADFKLLEPVEAVDAATKAAEPEQSKTESTPPKKQRSKTAGGENRDTQKSAPNVTRQPEPDLFAENESEVDSDKPVKRESRTLSRLAPAISQALLRVKLLRESGSIKFIELNKDAIGIPAMAFSDKETGVPLMAILVALGNEKILYTLPGQAKKIIEVTGMDGVTNKYVGVLRIYAKDLFDWDGKN